MRMRLGMGNGWVGTAAAALAVAGLLGAAPSASAGLSPGSTQFPRYRELEPNVAFWGQVFTDWSSKQVAFHDVEHLDLVYSVLSIADIVERMPEAQQDAAIQDRRRQEGERIAAMLRRIADGNAQTEEERRILKGIARIGQEPSYAATLADQVRSQRGLADKFCDAARRAASYRPMMARILGDNGVPEELLALPLVESGYKIGARSSAGAAGIWQFMPATGRLYLDVNSAVDERRDPVRSTEAAARMLRQTYDSLGSWPLAITSYNHGPGGVAKAVRDMGTTHFGVISTQYKGKAFGFASRNYYAEFLAAVDAMKRADDLCGPLQEQAYAPEQVTLAASASIRDLAKSAGTSVDALAELNPALSDACARGAAKVPRGYTLNLPSGTRNDFEVAFGRVDRSAPRVPDVVAKANTAAKPVAAPAARTAVPASASVVADAAEAPELTTDHEVARGQTLLQVAAMYGTTVEDLRARNGLAADSTLQAGQMLKVKTSGSEIAAAAPITRAWRVRSGDSLWTVARASDTTVETLKRLNPKLASRGIKAGDSIRVPAAGAVAAVDADDRRQAPTVRSATARAGEAKAGKVIAKAPSTKASARPGANVSAKASPQASWRSHRVQRGQTLSSIAAQYNTSVDALRRLNGMRSSGDLQAGATLKVPL